MIVVLEIIGFALLLGVIWVIYRAAVARPDEPGLLWAWRIGAATWCVFVSDALVDFQWLVTNPGTAFGYVLVLAVIVGAVFGYRRLLRRVQAMADRQ